MLEKSSQLAHAGRDLVPQKTVASVVVWFCHAPCVKCLHTGD